jgi:hypothetical protein
MQTIINLSNLKASQAKCPLCAGRGWTHKWKNSDPLDEEEICEMCKCQYRIFFYGCVGGEIYNHRKNIYNEELKIDRSYLLEGTWDEVKSHIRGSFLHQCRFDSLTKQLLIINDLFVREHSLVSLVVNPDEHISTYMGFSGLVVLRLGFAVSRNASMGAYLFEAVSSRINSDRPIWVTLEIPLEELSKQITGCKEFTQLLGSMFKISCGAQLEI